MGDTNECANDYLGLDRDRRPVVAFDLSGIDVSSITRARLVFTPDPSYETVQWGEGWPIDVHRLDVDVVERNSYVAYKSRTEEDPGTGSGITWKCRVDTRIEHPASGCDRPDRWKGGDIQSTPTDNFLQRTGAYDNLEFDVTADVIAGATNWLLMKHGDNPGVNERFLRLYSREGAPNEASAPRLIIEIGG